MSFNFFPPPSPRWYKKEKTIIKMECLKWGCSNKVLPVPYAQSSSLFRRKFFMCYTHSNGEYRSDFRLQLASFNIGNGAFFFLFYECQFKLTIAEKLMEILNSLIHPLWWCHFIFVRRYILMFNWSIIKRKWRHLYCIVPGSRYALLVHKMFAPDLLTILLLYIDFSQPKKKKKN